MMIGLKGLERFVQLELHHVRKIRNPDKRVQRFVVKNNTLFRDFGDPEKIVRPHLSKKAMAYTDVGAVLFQFRQQPAKSQYVDFCGKLVHHRNRSPSYKMHNIRKNGD
jgi:hypothetical protein